MTRVIVWLNGTFGTGKTATAAALVPLIPEARLFDPETVGYMLQPNLADHPVSDFQHWAPWRPLVVATAIELARHTGEHLIAPQTILNRDYLAEIVTGLRAAGAAVFHVLLDASDDTLRRRAGYRRVSSSMAMRPSSRASAAPRQWWVPSEKDRYRPGSGRSIRNSSGCSKTRRVAVGAADEHDDGPAGSRS